MNIRQVSLSLLSLWLSSTFAQEEVVRFEGVDDLTYSDWLQNAEYARHVYLPGQTPSDGAAIHWSIEDDRINLAVAVRATGWVGFGISENGGMRGADMVIFQADGEELIDAHVLDTLFPIPDACQSWSLMNYVAEGGFLIFEASRLLDTGDTQDHSLSDDRSLLTPANRIVAAWGDTPSYSSHGRNRARGSIRFFGDRNGDVWAAFANIMEDESEGSFELRADDFEIPARRTTYENFCFLESDLIAIGVPANTPLHGIGIEPIVDERASSYVHHFIVYGVSDPDNCYGGMEVAFTWAPGDLPLALPPTLGIPMGTGGFRAYRIQVHYNNPALVSGILDSSGVKVFWTRQMREHDVGVLQLGDPFLVLNGKSVGDGLTSHDFQCSSECSASLLSQPVTVVREQLHMHISGRRMFNEQIRDNEVLRVGTVDYFDYEQQGLQNLVQSTYDIAPGDAFRTKCYYDSKDEQFGPGSGDEMCIAFLFYYPKIRLPLLFACGVGYSFGPFTQCSSEWTREDLSSVEDLKRIFGAAPLSCPAVLSTAPAPISYDSSMSPSVAPPSTTRELPDDFSDVPSSSAVNIFRLITAALVACFASSWM